MESEENSSDIELTLDISEENIEDESSNMEVERIATKFISINKQNIKEKYEQDICVDTDSFNSLNNNLNKMVHMKKEISKLDSFDKLDLALNDNSNKLHNFNAKLSCIDKIQNNSNENKGKLLTNITDSIQKDLRNNEIRSNNAYNLHNHDVNLKQPLNSSLNNSLISQNENICGKPNKICNSNYRNSNDKTENDKKLNKNVKRDNIVQDNGTNDSSLNKIIKNQYSEISNGILSETFKSREVSSKENQKRKLSLQTNDEINGERGTKFPNHMLKKCTKINDNHSEINSDNNTVSDKEKSSITNTEKKKKTVNTARKHTNSNSAKVMRQINQILHSEFEEQKKKSDFVSDVNAQIEKSVEIEKVNVEESSSLSELPLQHDKKYKIKLKMDALSEDSLTNIFKTMKKRLTRRQLEEIILQKCCEVISESSEIGELKKQVAELQQAENFSKRTVLNLEKQIHQLKGVCSVFMEKVKMLKSENRIATPTVITRSVGLQVAFHSSPFVKNDCTSSATSGSEECNLTTTISHSKVNTSRNDNSNSFEKYANQISVRSFNIKSVDSRSHQTITVNENSGKSSLPSAVCNDEVSALGSNSLPQSNNKNESNNKNDNDSPLLVESAIIDLTEKDDKSDNNSFTKNSEKKSLPSVLNDSNTNNQSISVLRNNCEILRSKNHSESVMLRHPAPLPPAPACLKPSNQYGSKRHPPTPELKIYKIGHGISLSWNMNLTSEYANIAEYQIYAYQDTTVPANVEQWKLVGNVEALPLPMACTLTQFITGYTYHFTVRAVDTYGRIGPFSLAKSIAL